MIGLRGGTFALDHRFAVDARDTERPIGIDQSNTSVLLGDGMLVKCYRRLWPGEHPEVELVTYLGDRVGCVPRALGSLRYADTAGFEYTLALVQAFVPDARDGWTWGQELHETLAAGGSVEGWGGQLGEVTARLHAALAEAPGARPATDADRHAVAARAGRELDHALAVTSGEAADRLHGWAPRIRAELEALDVSAPARLSRIHGDLHVGQILQSPAGLDVIDFEGEPTRPPEERRAADLPLRDVASMLRSFEHLPRWVFRDRPDKLPQALAWAAIQRREFLDAYGSGGSVDSAVLRALEVEKATYEFVYAATFMPAWTPVALGAMDALLRP